MDGATKTAEGKRQTLFVAGVSAEVDEAPAGTEKQWACVAEPVREDEDEE